jgi:regulator of chromosome condensation
MTIPETLKCKLSINQIAVGGMHTLALTSAGTIYAWGCNDDSALGHDGNGYTPQLVTEIPSRVNGITAGDCHSMAYNTETSEAFIWGLYKNSVNGSVLFPKDKLPRQFGQELFGKGSK